VRERKKKIIVKIGYSIQGYPIFNLNHFISHLFTILLRMVHETKTGDWGELREGGEKK
jgi:hypothetical protein